MPLAENGLSEEQQQVKELFVEETGYWHTGYDAWLRLDPDFFERFAALAAHPWKHGSLDPKVRAFVSLAANACMTTRYNEGTRVHLGNALDHGAMVDEILEVFQLASVQGIQSAAVGTPHLVGHAGVPEDGPEDERQRQAELRAEFEERRGYWADLWENILAIDPDFFETYMEFSSYPWDEGSLNPKVRELVYVAIDIVTTLLHEPGTKIHAGNALESGATRKEVFEVFEIASTVGSHTFTEGVPILIDEAEKRGMLE
jgi:alkylhydroperoxidase/carboxymuconolactone decarboxylase family protein YurZ